MTFNFVQNYPNDEFGIVVFTGSSAGSYTLGDAHQTPGIKVVLKNEGTGLVTISTTNSQTIDGASTYALSNQYQEVTVTSDGSNWIVTAALSAAAVSVPSVSLTGQTAVITSTALFTPTVSGVFRVAVDGVVTTVGTAGTLAISLQSNNGVANFTQTTATASLTALGAETSTEFTFYAAAGQAVNYSTALAGATGTPAYALRIRASFLG